MNQLCAQEKTPVLIDDFGVFIKDEQATHVLSMQANALFSINSKKDTLGVIINARRGRIKEETVEEIRSYLKRYTGTIVYPEDYIIIDYSSDKGCCIAKNYRDYKRFKKQLNKRPLAKYVAFSSPTYRMNRNETYIDNDDLIKNTFFKYLNWNISEIFNVGGRVIIFPNNTFIRWYGEFGLFDNLDKIPKSK